MSSDGWPASDAPPPLPRLEDLPQAEQGYDREAVRAAFDAFYRHAAQLDVTLRALEAVEVFRRDADALRNDLRALRALGAGAAAAEPAWATASYERAAPRAVGVVVRLAAEAALIVAVAVIAGVAHFRSAVIVAVMAAAFLVVAVSEWLASRARFVPPAVAFLPVRDEREPAPYIEAPAPGWGLERGDELEPEALTMIEPAAAAADPWEQAAAGGELAEPGGDASERRRR